MVNLPSQTVRLPECQLHLKIHLTTQPPNHPRGRQHKPAHCQLGRTRNSPWFPSWWVVSWQRRHFCVCVSEAYHVYHSYENLSSVYVSDLFKLKINNICCIYIYNTYIHTYIHTYVRSTFVHTYIHSFIHSFIHTYIHTYIHAHTYIHPYTHIHTSIQTYRHTNIQTYKHTNIQTYKHTNIHTYIHTYTHTHIHTYTHTHIHTYIHTYICNYILYTCTHGLALRFEASLHHGAARPKSMFRCCRPTWQQGNSGGTQIIQVMNDHFTIEIHGDAMGCHGMPI